MKKKELGSDKLDDTKCVFVSLSINVNYHSVN